MDYGLCHLYAPEAGETDSVVFAFETGEIWSIDTALLGNRTHSAFGETVRSPSPGHESFLRALGDGTTVSWICGVVGVKNYRLEVPGGFGLSAGPSMSCGRDHRSGLNTTEKKILRDALNPFFRMIFEKSGVPYPTIYRVNC